MHSTCDLDDGYMGSGRYLRRSIRKYGINNFKKEILEFFETRELLIEAEKLVITSDMLNDTMCMNLMRGGEGGYVSKEHYQITSKIGGEIHANKMKNDAEYRAKVTKIARENFKKARAEGKLKTSKRFTGLTHNENSKKLMSEKAKQRTGNKNSQYGTCWITKDDVNKKIKKEKLETFINEGWVKGRK